MTSSPNPVLVASNIHKSYGDVEVLRGVDLSVNRGEVVSIVGRSGAGKTTLLQIAGTLDRPDSGQLFINNEDVLKLNNRKMAGFRNKHIGFIFQFHHLLPEFTAIENVCIPAFIGGVGRAEASKRAEELLQFLGLSHRLQHKPSALSGGEQQRVAVARALMNKPDIVFADEPSGNLDSVNSEELHNLFFKLRDEWGQTFIIVTHNESLAKMADRTLVMEDGRMVHTQ
ncbi:MAG: ABC transporter ATP-binding protein [Cryomorphaceae bacterium]|nr:MAG: ABC transporter ATP-binding protein [Cryomorphaceae bacterium]